MVLYVGEGKNAAFVIERFLEFTDGFQIYFFEVLDLQLQVFVDLLNVLLVFLADLQIITQFLVDINNLIVFSEDEGNLGASLVEMVVQPHSILSFLLPLFAQQPPFLFLSRKLFDLLPSLVLNLLLFQFLISNHKH